MLNTILKTKQWGGWNKGMKMSQEYCQKLSDHWKTHEKKGRFQKGMIPWNKGLKGYMAEEKNCNWKNGITPKNDKIRHSFEIKEWKKKVYERDKYTCQVCYKIGGRLNAHHIKPFSEHLELRFDVDNGQTLCERCHKNLKNFANSVNTRTVNAELGFLAECRDFTRSTAR